MVATVTPATNGEWIVIYSSNATLATALTDVNTALAVNGCPSDQTHIVMCFDTTLYVVAAYVKRH